MMSRLKNLRWSTVSRTLLAVILLAGVSFGAVKAKGILFPDWSGPTAGTYDKPVAEIGKKVTKKRPWSVETVASSIDGQVLAGKPISVVGEIIDISCYFQVGKHGDKHRGCGQKCAALGQPIGVLTKSGHVYTLIDEEHNARRDGLTTFRKQAIEHMAHIVLVHGTLSKIGGQEVVFVQGSVKQK